MEANLILTNIEGNPWTGVGIVAQLGRLQSQERFKSPHAKLQSDAKRPVSGHKTEVEAAIPEQPITHHSLVADLNPVRGTSLQANTARTRSAPHG